MIMYIRDEDCCSTHSFTGDDDYEEEEEEAPLPAGQRRVSAASLGELAPIGSHRLCYLYSRF